jgi:hypothetical protein
MVAVLFCLQAPSIAKSQKYLMKTLNTLLLFCLLAFSVDSFPQTPWPKQIRIGYTTSSNDPIDNIVIRYYNDPAVTTSESSYWDTRSINCCTYIASLKGVTPFAIQTRPLNFDRDTVGLLVASTQPGSFRLNFTQFENFLEAKEIWLLDTYLGIQNNVKSQPYYNFDITTNAASQGVNRFKMVFVAAQITLSCPGNITVNNSPGTNGAFASFSASVYSKCGSYYLNYSQLPNSFFGIGATTVTVNASDPCGNQVNCSFIVTVRDIEAPLINSVNPLYFETDPGKNTHLSEPVPPAAIDNSGAVTVTGIRNDGQLLNAPYPKGITMITWKAADASGNTATINQSITVSDHEPPVIQATDPYLYGCNIQVDDASLDPVVTDNCSGVTWINNYNNSASLRGAVLPLGATTVKWTATDASGNISTAQQLINVSDNKPPVIIPVAVQPQYTANSTGCTYKVAGSGFDPLFYDECSAATIKNSYNNSSTLAGAVIPAGIAQITWTVTDVAGNMATWPEVINVVPGFVAHIRDTSALLQGVQANTIYIGYSPASVLTYRTDAGINSYQWSVSPNLAITGATNTSTVKVTSTAVNGNQYTLYLTAVNALGCSAITSKVITVTDVRCGTKSDKVTICSPARKSQCVTAGTVSSSLLNGFTLGSCTTAARGEGIIEALNEMAHSISIYPNPTKGLFQLQLEGYNGKTRVVIIDMSGRTVFDRTINITQSSGQLGIDLSSNARGLYNIRVSSQDGVQVSKIVLAQ